MKRILAAVTAAVLLLLCACAAEETAPTGFGVYFLSRSDALEKLTIEYVEPPEDADIRAMMDFVLAALDKPGVEGNYSVIPAGVSVNAEVNGAVVTVDFGGKLMELSNVRRSVIIAGVVKSLLGIEGINYAYIKFQGAYIEPFYDRAVAGGMFVVGEL